MIGKTGLLLEISIRKRGTGRPKHSEYQDQEQQVRGRMVTLPSIRVPLKAPQPVSSGRQIPTQKPWPPKEQSLYPPFLP